MNVQNEAISDLKIANASTFSQVTFSQFPPCVLPLPADHLLTPAPYVTLSSLPRLSRPIGGMSLDTEADLTPALAQAVPASGSGQPTPPGFYG